MATLPAGYIPLQKVTASSSGSLGFIVCVQCFRMVDSVPIRHQPTYPVANKVSPSVDEGEMPAKELGTLQ